MTTTAVDPEQPDVIKRLIDARRGRREFVPIRRSFVQDRRAGGGPAPLSTFVTGRRRRALNLYLLVHSLASTEPWDVALRSWAWALALGMPDTPASRASISRTTTWLDANGLTRSKRDGTLRRIYLLDESGSGSPYTHPARTRSPDYFKLPYAYWTEQWHNRLTLPGTAVLLIGLSLGTSFVLPLENGSRWYGISRDSLRRGIRELVDLELMSYRTRFKRAPNAPTGATEERRYSLQGPFARAPSPARRTSRQTSSKGKTSV